MFSPLYMHDFASQAYIVNEDGTHRPLVKQEMKIVDVTPEEPRSAFPLSPMACLFVFSSECLCCLAAMEEAGDFLGMGYFALWLAGDGGMHHSLLVFSVCASTVGSNWLLILFNPIPLVYLPFMTYYSIKHKRDGFIW